MIGSTELSLTHAAARAAQMTELIPLGVLDERVGLRNDGRGPGATSSLPTAFIWGLDQDNVSAQREQIRANNAPGEIVKIIVYLTTWYLVKGDHFALAMLLERGEATAVPVNFITVEGQAALRKCAFSSRMGRTYHFVSTTADRLHAIKLAVLDLRSRGLTWGEAKRELNKEMGDWEGFFHGDDREGRPPPAASSKSQWTGPSSPGEAMFKDERGDLQV